jgi:hypothetical protein
MEHPAQRGYLHRQHVYAAPEARRALLKRGRHGYGVALIKTATGIDAAIHYIWPEGGWREQFAGVHAAAAAFLNHRAKPETIRKWRQGRRRAPQWAVDMILAELRKRMGELARAIEALEKENGPG